MIVRVREPGVDAKGAPVAGDVERAVLYGFHVAPRTSSDITGRGRDGKVEGLTLFGPPTDLIADSDLIEVNGELFRIEGTVGDWSSPFGPMVDGTSLALRKGRG